MLGENAGFKHISALGNTFPDKHFEASLTSTHPLLPLCSPTKHHADFTPDVDFCIGLSDVSALGSDITISKSRFVSLFTADLLAFFNRLPTDCTVPSAISTPVRATSDVISAVLLINVPAVYPKIANI